MRQTLHRPFARRLAGFVAFCLATGFVLTLTACSPPSPDAKVTATRGEYTVRLESFTANLPDPPDALNLDEALVEGEVAEAAMAEAAQGAEAEVAEVAEEVAEGAEEGAEEMAAEESGSEVAEVILHLLIQFKGSEALPGITVEVTQQDPFGSEKEPTLHWVETAGMVKNDLKQVDLKLEGIEYTEGDAFSVLLRQAVPAAERGGYREYAEAGP